MLLNASKAAKKFKALARKVARHPSASRVHALRVLTRRLRADFWLAPKPQRTRRLRQTRKELGGLCDVLGEQRKYDVALEDARRFRRDTDDIKSRLRSARDEVRRSLRKRKRKAVSKHIEKAARDLNRLPAEALAPRLEEIRKRLEKAEHHPPHSNRGRHRLRLEVKKARYVLDTLNRKAPRLNALQDHLGRWHDLIVLSEITGRSEKIKAAREKEWARVERSLPRTVHEASRALQNKAFRSFRTLARALQ